MSGARQHFFPRFLKKGFASKTSQKEVYTWVYTKEKEPYQSNTRNIGLAKFFYGTPEDSEADILITDKETEFASFIDELRNKTKGIDLEPRIPSELVTHLIVRTQHIRESLTDAGKTLVDLAHNNITSPQDFKKLLVNIIQTKPELIEESLRKEVLKKVPPGVPPGIIEKFIKLAKLLIPQIIEQQHEEGHMLSSNLLVKMNEEMQSLVKGAQVRVLSESVVPEKHLEKFEKFRWKLIVVDHAGFILGDIGPIGFYKPEGTFQPFLFSKGELASALLPISDTHIIVGSSQSPSLEHSWDEINEAIASLSKYYFIPSTKNERNMQLSKLIGSRSLNISDTDISGVKTQIRKDFYGET
jgi:hypothetical protein